MGLRDIDLKEKYSSDKNNIAEEFFFPCLNHCVEYDRCVDSLQINSLIRIAMGFDNFSLRRAKLRIITGHMLRNEDMNMLKTLFSKKQKTESEHTSVKNSQLRKLHTFVDNGQIELKIAIPNSESRSGSFSERVGIFSDQNDQKVVFTDTSQESFSVRIKDFESIDVFTSWNDKSRVDVKIRDFEDLWSNDVKYVEVCDFMDAYEQNLLKFATHWIFED